jgi:hypothetical protein
VPSLHEVALQTLAIAQSAAAAVFKEQQQLDALATMAPVTLHCSDILLPSDSIDLSTVGVVFCYCSTWPARGDVLTSLSYAIGSQFAAGTVIVTTDRQLASEPGVWEFEQLHTVQGTNQETGGSSTAYIWKLVLSARGLTG